MSTSLGQLLLWLEDVRNRRIEVWREQATRESKPGDPSLDSLCHSVNEVSELATALRENPSSVWWSHGFYHDLAGCHVMTLITYSNGQNVTCQNTDTTPPPESSSGV